MIVARRLMIEEQETVAFLNRQSPIVNLKSGIMESLFSFISDPGPCEYLPDREWSLQYEIVGQLSADEYLERMKAGWRRFGFRLFRPACVACKMCLSLRVPVATFAPDRSQRRALAANDGKVTLVIGSPTATRAKIDLYKRFHQHQHVSKGWPNSGSYSAGDYEESFVDNPFANEEWCYYLGKRLVAVGYVDALAEGLSAIYFFYDPDERGRSLGTYNVLSLIRGAERRNLPHVYLGYYVAGCRSLEYKARFRPNEVLDERGEWRGFLS